MSREYDIGEIRQIGSTTCPAIAESYEDVAARVSHVSIDSDGLFGSHSAGGTWHELYKLIKTAMDESVISIDAMGRTLVEIADAYQADEDLTSTELDGLMSDSESHYDEEERPEVAGDYRNPVDESNRYAEELNDLGQADE